MRVLWVGTRSSSSSYVVVVFMLKLPSKLNRNYSNTHRDLKGKQGAVLLLACARICLQSY